MEKFWNNGKIQIKWENFVRMASVRIKLFQTQQTNETQSQIFTNLNNFQTDDQNTNQQFGMEHQMRTSLSPQSSNSSNTHAPSSSNPWGNPAPAPFQHHHFPHAKQPTNNNNISNNINNNINNNNNYQLSLAQQQLMLANLQQNTFNSMPKQIARSNSPMNFPSLANLSVFQHQQHQQHQQQQGQHISRSNTPSNFVLASQMAGADEFAAFGGSRGTTCMTQNFNQLSQMMGGSVNELVPSISDLNGFIAANGFSDIQTEMVNPGLITI